MYDQEKKTVFRKYERLVMAKIERVMNWNMQRKSGRIYYYSTCKNK